MGPFLDFVISWDVGDFIMNASFLLCLAEFEDDFAVLIGDSVTTLDFSTNFGVMQDFGLVVHTSFCGVFNGDFELFLVFFGDFKPSLALDKRNIE